MKLDMDSRISPNTGAEPFASDSSEHVPATNNDRAGWLDEELRDQDVPEFGLNQWLLHFIEDVLLSGLPDGKLLNFFCSARDKTLILLSHKIWGDSRLAKKC